MTDRILLVDDEPDLQRLVLFNLREAGFEADAAGTGNEGLAKARAMGPQVVILDLMLPDTPGTEVCRQMRADPALADVAILMLTARGDEYDRVLGFEVGADDYVVKPFSPRELVARVRAVLRRAEGGATARDTVQALDVTIDVPAHTVSRNGEEVKLTPLEFDLLVALARKPRQVFTREVLLEQVWGYRHAADTRLVNVHVQRLRSKVERDPEHPEIVLTVRGVGYKAGPP